MAKELILVPKVKYERLLQKLEPVDTSSRENDQTSKPTPEDKVQLDSDLMDKTNLLQTGTGYITKNKMKVGKPPGISNVRRKKKHVPWLTY
jgi:hypothetical protein